MLQKRLPYVETSMSCVSQWSAELSTDIPEITSIIPKNDNSWKLRAPHVISVDAPPIDPLPPALGLIPAIQGHNVIKESLLLAQASNSKESVPESPLSQPSTFYPPSILLNNQEPREKASSSSQINLSPPEKSLSSHESTICFTTSLKANHVIGLTAPFRPPIRPLSGILTSFTLLKNQLLSHLPLLPFLSLLRNSLTQ